MSNQKFDNACWRMLWLKFSLKCKNMVAVDQRMHLKAIVGLHWKETVLVDWIGNVVTSFGYEKYFVDRPVSKKSQEFCFKKCCALWLRHYVFWCKIMRSYASLRQIFGPYELSKLIGNACKIRYIWPSLLERNLKNYTLKNFFKVR